MEKGLIAVTCYIALIHKDPDSIYGVAFPDVPGVTAAADTLDDAVRAASEVLAFAAADWQELRQESFPQPRTIDAIRSDSRLAEELADAIVAVIPLTEPALAA